MKLEKSTYERRAFVNRFMREGGLSYTQATRVYEAMCGVFCDAIVTGNRVTIGRVGALMPVWRPPREVNMHFRRKPGNVLERVHRTFFMDGRYDFKFRLYRKFIEQHELHWYTQESPEPTVVKAP